MKRTVAGNLAMICMCSCVSLFSVSANGQTIASSVARHSTARPTDYDLARAREALVKANRNPRYVAIGVGPQMLNYILPSSQLDAAKHLTVRVLRLPTKGRLTLHNRPLAEASSLKLADIITLAYEPLAETEDEVLKAELVLEGPDGRQGTPFAFVVLPALEECDVLAGEPFDLQGVSKPGVNSAYLSGKSAHRACVSAITRHPNVVRFVYQLGRAELAMGNAAAALQLFKNAAQRKHYRAHTAIGSLYAFGGGVAVDQVQAVKYFRIGASFGDPYALHALGKRLFRGFGVKRNRKRGLTLMLQAAELGHTYSMNALGTIFYRGEGVKKNLARALDLYHAAAKRRDIYGYNNMGMLFLDGLVVRKDYSTAMKWFMRAHQAGHPYAATNLGRMYFNGWGVAKNLATAATWYEHSARRGDAWAAYNLAWIRSEGPRHLRNLAVAARYFALAAVLERGKPSRLARTKLRRIPARAKRAAILGSPAARTIGVGLPARGKGYNKRMEGTLLALARWQWRTAKTRIDLLGSSKL